VVSYVEGRDAGCRGTKYEISHVHIPYPPEFSTQMFTCIYIVYHFPKEYINIYLNQSSSEGMQWFAKVCFMQVDEGRIWGFMCRCRFESITLIVHV
jgi:hypothetical protein